LCGCEVGNYAIGIQKAPFLLLVKARGFCGSTLPEENVLKTDVGGAR